jgi:hypothetical protein
MPYSLTQFLMMMAFIGLSLLPLKLSWAETPQWNGLWFECEFSGRQTPPGDDCNMLDDDGFYFEESRVSYMKVIDSPETDSCKKQRPGQCVRADQPAVTVTVERRGKAKFTETTIGLNFLACTQIFHMTKVKSFYEARPDEDRCFWAGEKYFYLRQYNGTITVQD